MRGERVELVLSQDPEQDAVLDQSRGRIILILRRKTRYDWLEMRTPLGWRGTVEVEGDGGAAPLAFKPLVASHVICRCLEHGPHTTLQPPLN